MRWSRNSMQGFDRLCSAGEDNIGLSHTSCVALRIGSVCRWCGSVAFIRPRPSLFTGVYFLLENAGLPPFLLHGSFCPNWKSFSGLDWSSFSKISFLSKKSRELRVELHVQLVGHCGVDLGHAGEIKKLKMDGPCQSLTVSYLQTGVQYLQ